MEQESRYRRRRSIRNLRRASDIFTDSFTPAFEVDLKTDSCNDDLTSVYGSIWLEGDTLKDSDSLRTCTSENNHTHNATARNRVSHSPSTCSEGEFSQDFPEVKDNYSDYKFLIEGSHVTTSGLQKDTSLSLHDTGSGDMYSQSLRQQTMHSGVDVERERDASPYTTGAVFTCINHYPQTSLSQDGLHLIQENLILSHNDGHVSKNKRLHEEESYHGRLLKENIPWSNEVDTVFTEEVVSNGLPVRSPDSESAGGIDDDGQIAVAHPLKERRKGDRLHEEPGIVKDSESKPKKRKRLSLKKDHSQPTVLEAENVEHPATSDLPVSTFVVDREPDSEIIMKVMTKDSASICNTHSADTSQYIDGCKWLEHSDGINCVDYINSVDFMPMSSCEKRSKRSPQAKAKAARRSSRLFHPWEMPLADLSLEQIPPLETSSPFKSEMHKSETITSVTKLNGRMSDRVDENKENIYTMNIHTVGEKQELENEQSTEFSDEVPAANNFFVKNLNQVEGVVEDFANLCVNEKIEDADLDQSLKFCHDKIDHTEIMNTDVHGSEKTNEADSKCIQILFSHADSRKGYIHLSDSSGLQESVSNDQELNIDTGKCVPVCEKQICNSMDDQQFPLHNYFSTPSTDIDIELPPPDDKQAEDEVDATVLGDSGKCMRLRRGRKSWDTSQKVNPEIKKPPRRKSRQGDLEDRPVNSNEVEATVSSVDATMIDVSDNEDIGVISPGLLTLYQNKNFVRPQPRSWETIKESPKSSHFLFTKQRHKCFLEFDTGITRAKLQRRHKKAADVYKRIGGPPSMLSDKEFEQRLLDIQVLLDGFV